MIAEAEEIAESLLDGYCKWMEESKAASTYGTALAYVLMKVNEGAVMSDNIAESLFHKYTKNNF